VLGLSGIYGGSFLYLSYTFIYIYRSYIPAHIIEALKGYLLNLVSDISKKYPGIYS